MRLPTTLAITLVLTSFGCSGMQTGQNSEHKTLKDFGIRASNLFLYYDDLGKATTFYTRTLGMELVGDYGMASILRIAPTSYLILVQSGEGMHTTAEPRTVALALLTDQLEEWFAYLQTTDIEFRSQLTVREGSAHDGFVVLDPQGYLLEFERFNRHAENEKFIPALARSAAIYPKPGASDVPEGLGFGASVTWQYYKDLEGIQRFYEDVLGLELVADQGWTKIYQGSRSGFVGLVDESRGMHRFSQDKSVNVSFIIDDLEGWFEHVRANQLFELRSPQVSNDAQARYSAFVGFDPENYYMEFNRFYAHEIHPALFGYLSANR